jgi:hypothetical protein
LDGGGLDVAVGFGEFGVEGVVFGEIFILRLRRGDGVEGGG